MVVSGPPHLHGDSPALHGREAVAHVAVAAIERALGGVRLRQISPHGQSVSYGFTPEEKTLRIKIELHIHRHTYISEYM